MGIRSVQEAVSPYLSQGLGASEVQAIVDHLVGSTDQWDPRTGGYKPRSPNSTEKLDIVRLVELYGRLFSASGAKELKKLTGVSLDARGKPSYPTDFLPAGRLHEVRAAMSKSRAELNRTMTVRRAANGRISISSSHKPSARTLEKLRAVKARAQREGDWCGWWKISGDGKGWNFKNIELAGRCYELVKQQGVTGVEIEARSNEPDPRYRDMFNMKGPFYE